MTGEIVLCWSEDPELAARLVTYARSLNVADDDRVVAAVLGPPSEATRAAYGAAGAHAIVHSTDLPPTPPDPALVAGLLRGLVEASSPTLLLFGSTKRGREVGARLAGLLDLPAVTGVSRIEIAAGSVSVEREMLSGNAIAHETIARRPALIALMPGFPTVPLPPSSPEVGTVRTAATSLTTSVEVRPKTSGGTHLESADRIVTVGRGLGKKDDLALIEELAEALGAAVGCTRPLAAEAGWLSDDHWIGLTGHRVKPKLYVAIGVSGAVQHLVGMRDSGTIVAINKDPNAPIFTQADYRVTGDLYAIVPALTRALRSGGTNTP